MAIPMKASEMADIIESSINGTCGDWDDSTSISLKDPELEIIRKRCCQLDLEFPPEKKGHFTNEQGLMVLRKYIVEFKSK